MSMLTQEYTMYDEHGFLSSNNLHNDTFKTILQNYRDDDKFFDPETESYLIVFYCTVIFIGTFSNVVVCYIVWKNHNLRKPRNIFIVNIAVCDIIMCTFCMPFSLVKLTMKNWHLGLFLCKVVPSLQNIDVFVSTFTIVAIALDRYWAIVCACVDINMKKVYIMLVIIWTLALFCCIPMFLFHKLHFETILNEGVFQTCIEEWPSDNVRVCYTLFVTFIQYLTPLAVVSTIHSRICYVLRMRVTRDPVTETEMRRELRDVKRHKRNMLLLTAIAVTFGITWLPWTVLNITADINYKLLMHKQFNLVYAICLLVAMSSACANPVLYGWFNINFRDAFTHSFFFWRKDSVDSQEMVTFNKTSNDRRS